MKRKIFLSMICIVVVAVFAAAGLALQIAYSFFENQMGTDIRTQATLIAAGYEQASDKQALLDSLDTGSTDFRISLIEPDGNVCFDTYANSDYLQDHLTRPEIAEALKTGQGASNRYSETLKRNVYYHAIALSDGNIIRVAGYTGSRMTIFSSTLPVILGITILLLVLCSFLAKWLTSMVVKPLTKLGDNLDELSEDENYDELNPFVEKICKQNHTITKQVEKLKSERDMITMITDNMKEGLVLLGPDRYILSVNRGALAFLNRHTDMDFVGQNLIVLTREQSLLQAADSALSGKASDGLITLKDITYRYFSNPVYTEGNVDGALLLLWDVTEAQKAEKMRREFSSNVSHELKTPLTTISGFAEMIENDMVKNPDDLRHFAGLILRESSRLQNLIEDVMRLSRMEEGVDAKGDKVEPFAIAQTVRELLSPKAETREVTVSVEGKPCVFNGNRNMIEELLYNLVDNAIKYNKPSGKVTVSVGRDAGNCVIKVIDTGIGIPSEHRDRIFERFYRVDKSRSKETGGTGLGLAIVKHAAEFHGGTVSLDSKEDIGTTITIIIPA